jgi:hypothetical protein
MSLFELSEFFKLSSVLNYNLSAASLNRYNVLRYIMAGKRLCEDEKLDRELKGILMEALDYLFRVYHQKRRHLGPMAVLHPLRATALLTRALDRVDLLDILATLFHDILEDVQPLEFDAVQWKEIEAQLHGLLKRLTAEDENRLVQRMVCLTRTSAESYYQYIGRMLDTAKGCPGVIHVKLADRLDNTMDMRIDLEDPLDSVDFFKAVFQVLFVGNYPGYEPGLDHQPTNVMNGARRLYQLFKNAVLLSLIRQNDIAADSPAQTFLFHAVCQASLMEAQRTLLHLLGYHIKEAQSQRKLLLESMDYCYSGRSDLVTRPESSQLLDGLFSTYFAPTGKNSRSRQLDLLYQNKPLMIEASVAFIVIFFSFLNDPAFFVQGISSEGIEPK